MFFRHPKSESDLLKFVHLKIREHNLAPALSSGQLGDVVEFAQSVGGAELFESVGAESS